MYKPKNERVVTAQLTTFTRLVLSRINLLSLKPIILSSTYMLDRYDGTKKTNSIKHMLKKIKIITDLASGMQEGIDPNPNILHKQIMECVIAYVNIFYNASSADRKKYMSVCIDDSINKDLEPHHNMLIMPAFMAELEKPKELVINSIVSELYRKPILFMYKTGKQSMYVNGYIRSMAMDSSSSIITERIHKILNNMHEMIMELETNMPDPSEHSRKKEEFMSEISALKKDQNINIFDSMAGKIMPFEYKGSRFMRR